MNTGFPKLTHSAKLGEKGVDIVSRLVSDTFGWLFRRTHQELDFGIDGQIEIVTEDGAVTGQMLAIQIKCGKSFLEERNQWGYVYRGKTKHFNYLANYPIPVIICLCDPESLECYWVRFQVNQTQVTDEGWKITIPFKNILSSSKSELYSLVPKLSDSLTDLQDYWSLNKMIVESSIIIYSLGKDDILEQNTSSPREFYDRLLTTKELAHECQGKVEFSFSGYDDDPRELYEIEEVRQYIAILSPKLPELFFFISTEKPAGTLITFSLCQTDISFKGEPSKNAKMRRIEFETSKVAEFLESHFYGLNEMTDWLNMPVEENKVITLNIFRCLGFDIPSDAT